MSWQDVDLLDRLALVGAVEKMNNKWVGRSLPNDPANAAELMAGPKQRRERVAEETSIKTANTSSELGFAATRKRNNKMCRRRPGHVQVNFDREIGVAVEKIVPEARVARLGVARPGEPASSGSLAEAVPASKKRPRPPEAGDDTPGGRR